MLAAAQNAFVPSQRAELLAATPASLQLWCAQVGQPPYRAGQILQWVFRQGAMRFDDMSNLPKPLRAALDAHFVFYGARAYRQQAARDGTTKLLLEWPAGGRTECVLIPEGPRRTACISTQVGCPVACVFCASGIAGLERNLSSAEIVEQAMRLAALARPDRLSNVVLMGLGEPLANYDATVAACRVINAEWGMNVGARKITISTVGLPSRIMQLAGENLQVTLALSLHAPADELRRRLIPWAKSVEIDQLVEAVRHYFERTGREVTIEYVLLARVNDRPEHARQLAKVARRMRCNVNLIRYNPVAGLPYERPTSSAAAAFQAVLRAAGVNTHVRKSRGLDIEAACGQLRRSVAHMEKEAASGTA